MTISEFYNRSEIIEAFGVSRTKKVISQLRECWPDFLGEGENKLFPFYNRPLNSSHAAWLIFILCNCRSADRQSVVNAILRGKDLRCQGELFIVWFAQLLSNPLNVNGVQSVFIFDQDSTVHVTPNVEKGNLTTKIFQGITKTAHISRAAILDQNFLSEIAALIHESVSDDRSSEQPIFSEDGRQFTNENEAVQFYEANKADEDEILF